MSQALYNPTLPGRPEVKPLLFSPSALVTKDCLAVLIDEQWILTAAHCFTRPAYHDALYPSLVDLIQWGAHVATPADVRFHPQAWASGAVEWTEPMSIGELQPSYDLALIRLSTPETGIAPAKLWHPAPYTEVGEGHNDVYTEHPSTLEALSFAPSLGTSNFQPNGITAVATGEDEAGEIFVMGARSLEFALLYPDTHTRLIVSRAWDYDPPMSLLAPADHGGGLFITAFADSQPFGQPCIHGGNTGEEVLVGIAHATSWEDYDPEQPGPQAGPYYWNGSMEGTALRFFDTFVSVYDPLRVEWIARTVGDLDADGVCDHEDSCLGVPDLHRNCNVLAESHPSAWESNGRLIDDACDPAPCPNPDLEFTSFEVGANLGYIETGRAIHDRIAITPVLEVDTALVPVTSSYAQPLFCVCRYSDGTPITDPELCKSAPYWCALNPRQDDYAEMGGGAQPGQEQTYWHAISTDAGPKWPVVKGEVPAIDYPGPVVERTWAYWSDYNYWLAQGWIAAAQPVPFFPDGTDLAGALWTHDETEEGAFGPEHQVAACEVQNPFDNCSIADGFIHGVAPDLRTVRDTGWELDQLKPDPWWEYCAYCSDKFHFPGERAVDPAPMVTLDPATLQATVWLEHGGYATEALSYELRKQLADAHGRWVIPSEPMAYTSDASLPRALQLTLGGAVNGIGFGTSSGFDWAQVPLQEQPLDRAGFAAAYSRIAGALFVAGGSYVGSPAPWVLSWWPARNLWTAVRLQPAELTPTNVQAATYSRRDWRMWVVEDGPAGRALLRIDPATGLIGPPTELTLLGGLIQIKLTTVEDGRVLVAGNGGSFTLALLDSNPYTGEVTVVSVLEGEGELVATPVVRDGLISLAVELPASGGGAELVLESVTVAELEGIAEGGKITLCHLPPGNTGRTQTLSVGAPALGAHLGHGDRLGACP